MTDSHQAPRNNAAALSLGIISLLSIGAGAWYGWHYTQQQQSVMTEMRQTLTTITAQDQQWRNSLTDNLQAITTTQQNLQQNVADLRTQINGGAQKFVEAQRLHAAEYLIGEAEKTLLLSQDIPAAMQLLVAAEQELSNSMEASSLALRKLIHADVTRLQSLNGVDALAVARQLGAALERVASLRDLQPGLNRPETEMIGEIDDASLWGSLWKNLKQFSGEWFLVRHYGAEVEAPLSTLEAREVKQSLSLALATAQTAALRHEQGMYYNAVEQAITLIKTHYAGSIEGQKLQQDLEVLATRLVSVNASLSLQSAQLMHAAHTSDAADARVDSGNPRSGKEGKKQ